MQPPELDWLGVPGPDWHIHARGFVQFWQSLPDAGWFSHINRNQIQNISGEWSKYYCRLENESLFLRCPFLTKCVFLFPLTICFSYTARNGIFRQEQNWRTDQQVTQYLDKYTQNLAGCLQTHSWCRKLLLNKLVMASGVAWWPWQELAWCFTCPLR